MKWISVNDQLPPLNTIVECLWRYIPCEYYLKIAVAKKSDAKTFTGLCYRKSDRKMGKGWKWTCEGVGDPSSNVEAWRHQDLQLTINFN